MGEDKLEKIRQTVKKMIAADTPREDIVLFLESRGLSPRQLAAHNQVDRTIKDLEKQMELRKVGTGRGLLNAWEGFKSIFFDDDGSVVEGRNEYEKFKSQESPENQMAMGQGEFIGETAPYTAIPAGAAGSTLPVRMAAGMAGGGAVMGSQYVPPGENETRTRIGNVGQGVVLGGATTAALEPVRIVAGRASNPAVSGKERAVTNLGDKHGVPLSAGDVKGGALQSFENAMQEIPLVGMARYRRKQQAFSEAAARKATDRFPAKEQGESGVDAFGKPLFTGWQVDAQASIKSRLGALKRAESSLYKKASDVADQYGAMPLRNAINEIDAIIKEESKKIKPSKELIKAMTAEKEILVKASQDRSSKFSNVHEYRQGVIDDVDSFYTGKDQLLPKKDVRAYQRLKKALDKDMEEFTKSVDPRAFEAWKKADGFHSSRVAPYREEALLRGLANEKDPVALYNAFLTGVRTNPQTVYTSLGKKGQAAVRGGIVKDAFDKAYSEKLGFDPQKFGQFLLERQKEIGVFFKGTDAAEIKGLTKLFQHMDNAGEFVNKPKVMARLQSIGAGVAAGVLGYFSPKIIGASAAGVAAISHLLSTKAGRDFVLSANKAKPGPQMQKVIDHYAPRLAAVIAGEQYTGGH